MVKIRLTFFLSVLVIGIILFGFTDLSEIIPQADNIASDSMSDTSELEEDEAIISRVIDGDTLLVIDSEGEEERVRLLLIDTPESVHPDEPEEKYGPESSEYAEDYFDVGDKVTLEVGKPKRDKYDRLLAYVWKDGENFNKLMVEKGYARIAYVNDSNDQYLDEFEEAEKQAKKQQKKIWSIDGYVTDEGFDMSVVE